jgi:cytochrome c-type biogenesis protein
MFSPCSVAMLPSYLSLYLAETGVERQLRSRRALRALCFSLVVTVGYTLLSVAVGLLAGTAGQVILPAVPWLVITIGLALIGLGGWLLSGGHFSLGILGQTAIRMRGVHVGLLLGYLLFGIAYGLAALSCTLPVFLVVVVSAFAARGFVSGAIQFLFYSLGMAIIFIGVAMAAIFLEEALRRWLVRFVPFMGKIMGGLLVVSGSYIVYYWLGIGGLLGSASG